MKIRRLLPPTIAFGAGLAALFWVLTKDRDGGSLAPTAQPPHPAPEVVVAKDRVLKGAPMSPTMLPTQRAIPIPATGPVVSGELIKVNVAPAGYGELASQGKLTRQERRLFEAQKWEVDLRAALELPAHVRLERRSGIYAVPGFKYPQVRVDRVYRMDRAGAAAAVVPPVLIGSTGATQPVADSTPVASSAGTPTTAVPTVRGTGLLDVGGGEVVWENAMVADHLMVQAQSGISEAQLAAALPPGTQIIDQVTPGGLYLVGVPNDGEKAIERAVLALNQLSGVIQFAEPNFLVTGADTMPDDPGFMGAPGPQWSLPQIMAPRAWDVVTKPKTQSIADSTVVAVVDTGIDYTHPDLAANVWSNPGEQGGASNNGSDDDANGKIDDWRGWNFVDGNNDPMDDVGHGTHVAGIIGAVGNNTEGIAGVCWGVKILPLRIIKAMGGGTYGVYSDAVAALDYIRTLNTVTRRVAVANHSWGGNGYSLAMLNVINNPVTTTDPLPAGIAAAVPQDVNTLMVTGTAGEIAKIKIGMGVSGAGIPLNTLVTIVSGSSITLSDYTTTVGSNVPLTFFNPIRAKPYGVAHVAAAGNSRFNADRIPTYPACLPSGFMISVGASDSVDAVSLWAGTSGSNYGRLNVDLFAPGSGIWSTRWKAPGDPAYGYESRNGTSMAAPHVSGALALVRMWQPKLTELQARQVLIEQVDLIPALQGKCVSNGRLNIARIMDKLYQPRLVGSGGASGGTGVSALPLEGAAALSGRLAVATSGEAAHALAVVGDRVWSWGSNDLGELGDATAGTERTVPVEIPGLNAVTMVAAGVQFSMALRADGTVWVWGSNANGLFGNGTKDALAHHAPVQVPGLTDIVWISVAPLDRPYCLAVGADGTVRSWGNNSLGQLGLGSTAEALTPTLIPNLADIIQAKAGLDHAVALTKDGNVYAWGPRFGFAGWTVFGTPFTYGNYGWNSLGDGPPSGSQPDEKSPVLVPGLSGIVQVEAGLEYSLALAQDGTVWEWGHFLRTDVNEGSHVPVQKAGLNRIVALSGGAYHCFAQDADGRVFGWGLGTFGSLGNGAEVDVAGVTSVVVPQDDPILSIAAGAEQSLAVTADGKLLAWGLNQRGQLGAGRSAAKVFPVKLTTDVPVTKTATDGLTQLAVTSTGKLLIWGFIGDFYGISKQLQHPTEIALVQDVVDVDMGLGGAFFRKSDGTIFHLDTGDVGLTVTAAPNPFIPISGATAFAATQVPDPATEIQDYPHMLVITTGGAVKSFGGNEHGQLGNGSTTTLGTLTYFTQSVAGLSSGVTSVAAGLGHSLAVKSDGTVVAWGRNDRGQLGDGTRITRTTPVAVPGLTNVVRVRALEYFSCAITTDGSVYAWGGTTTTGFPELGIDQLAPTLIAGLPPVSDIIPSSRAMIVILPDSTALAWSQFHRAVLARDPSSILPTATPAPVTGLSGLSYLDHADSVALAVKSDGTLWAWGGGDGTAILGDGDSWASLPIYVTNFAGTSNTQSTLGTGSTADSWLFQNFSVGELLSDSLVADAADPDQDGISNLLEYALDLDPRINSRAGLPTQRLDLVAASAQSESTGGISLFSLPTVDLTEGKRYQALTINRNGIRSDINYIVEVTSDLVNWQSGDPFTITVLDTAETLEVYDATAIEDATRRFMRLKIQRK